MSSTTPNLNLLKPAGTDFVNVADLNSNFDIIDTAVGNIQNSLTPISIDSLSTMVTANSTYVSGRGCGATIIGKIVSFRFGFTANAQINANAVINIGNMKSPYLPAVSSACAGSDMFGEIRDGGQIWVRVLSTVPANGAMWFSGCYIMA